MSCTNPMLMLVTDIKGYNLSFINQLKKCNWKINFETHKAYRLVSQESRSYFLEMLPEYSDHSIIEVPCGGCISCRLDYSRDWANRCTLESLQYECNYFVTLTYDDDHLHYGELGNPTICKEDLDKFIKDLRQKLSRKLGHTGLRYFYCQEYGDRTNRPHAHLILFNCPLPDLIDYFPQDDGSVIRQKNEMTGDWYQYSQFIKDCWDKGNILIANCNWNTNAYVSRYILKKQKGKNGSIYSEKLGIVPPYIRMSNRPGIGQRYYDDHKVDLSNHPYIILPRDHKNPLCSMIPRYYKKKLYVDNPQLREEWYQKSIISIDKNRSLLKGKQLINHNRAIQEDHIKKANEVFNRDVD